MPGLTRHGWQGLPGVAAGLLLSAALLFMAMALHAQGSPPTARRFALSLVQGAAWSPTPIEVHRGLILFRAVLNGRDATVLLDNGAANSFVDRRFVDPSGTAPRGAPYVASTGAGVLRGHAVDGVTLTVPNQLDIKGTLIALDLAPFSRIVGRPIDAVLGADALDQLAVMIRPADRTLYLTASGKMTPRSGAKAFSLPMSAAGRISAQINDEPVLLAVDLGSNGAIRLSDAAFARVLGPAATNRRTAAANADGQVRTAATADAAFTLGPVRANIPVAAGGVLPSGLDGRLGMAFLSKFTIILDQRQQRLTLVSR